MVRWEFEGGGPRSGFPSSNPWLFSGAPFVALLDLKWPRRLRIMEPKEKGSLPPMWVLSASSPPATQLCPKSNLSLGLTSVKTSTTTPLPLLPHILSSEPLLLSSHACDLARSFHPILMRVILAQSGRRYVMHSHTGHALSPRRCERTRSQ
jgi:hypothetical protein